MGAVSGSVTNSSRNFHGLVQAWELDYNLQACIVRNAHAGTVSVTKANMRGLPVQIVSGKAQLTAAASINTANALILEADKDIVSLATATDSTTTAICLVRGPAVFRESAIRLTSAAGEAITLATVKTALLATSPPILTIADGANVVNQTT